MDQLVLASLSHTHYWYEVGMLKVLYIGNRNSNQVKSLNRNRDLTRGEPDLKSSKMFKGRLLT